ncbi:helix-turn-helix transcriptional regulator [Gordonibacter pamelaeae]|uniref:helix-turn-helix transcriptional regulator n=1 Tax=Gordonibacter pamelaeae TaxID=471189 RepID=UPI003A94C3F8
MSFRGNLQHLRAERNMTQEQLAMLLGVSRQSVTKGRRSGRPPSWTSSSRCAGSSTAPWTISYRGT